MDDGGFAALVYGPITASTTLNLADATISGLLYYHEVGNRVAGLGDVDSDRYDDLLIGARGASDNGSISGAALLFYGSGSRPNGRSRAEPRTAASGGSRRPPVPTLALAVA